MITARRLVSTSIATLALLAPTSAADAATAQPRVIAGSSAADTQFPYQARLSIRFGSSTYLCGAVIRDATHVMTAAHCVVNESWTVAAPSDVTIYYGAADRSQQRSVGAYQIQPAPQYVARDVTYDAALITLSSPLAGYGGSTVQPIALASPAETSTAVATGVTATVSGWGKTEQGTIPAVLRSTGVTLRPDGACASTYGSARYPASRYVCAGGTGSATWNPDSCNGDSGGPLVVTTANGLRLVGLVSFGDASGCGQAGVPAAYTEVSGAAINPLLTGTTAEAPTAAPAAGAGQTTTPVTTTTAPARPSAPAPVAPTARVVGLRCLRHLCTARVTGRGSALTVRVARRARRCANRGTHRTCRTTSRNVASLRPARTGNGYTVSLRLRPGSYRLSAVATSAGGARSAPAARAFRVRR